MLNFIKKLFSQNTIHRDDTLTGEKLTFWKFDELIKILITLSSTCDRQKELIGYGAVAEEMAEDFKSYYSETFESYIRMNLINEEIKSALDNLDQFFEDRSNGENEDFWDDAKLEFSTDWNNVREQAKVILIMMKKDDLEIEFERIERNEKSDSNKDLVVQILKLN